MEREELIRDIEKAADSAIERLYDIRESISEFEHAGSDDALANVSIKSTFLKSDVKAIDICYQELVKIQLGLEGRP